MTRTLFTLPAPIHQAFTELYGEGADDTHCETFASRWGGLELEHMRLAFEQGSSDDRILAILALGAANIPELETLLLPLIEVQGTPRTSRWTSALCLSRKGIALCFMRSYCW